MFLQLVQALLGLLQLVALGLQLALELLLLSSLRVKSVLNIKSLLVDQWPSTFSEFE